MQHVRLSPKAQNRSGRDKLSRALAFKWERFLHISGEVTPLWKAHYREVALDQDLCPLDPDWEWYFELDRRGLLHILTARAENKRLVGYIFNIVGPHNHYASNKFGHTEMFWLHPYFRRGWAPLTFFKENLAGLKDREVEITQINFKLGFQNGRVGKLLARLGYVATDITMRKRLV